MAQLVVLARPRVVIKHDEGSGQQRAQQEIHDRGGNIGHDHERVGCLRLRQSLHERHRFVGIADTGETHEREGTPFFQWPTVTICNLNPLPVGLLPCRHLSASPG